MSVGSAKEKHNARIHMIETLVFQFSNPVLISQWLTCICGRCSSCDSPNEHEAYPLTYKGMR